MQFEKKDLAQCENLIRALKKAKFELDGMEVLAFSDMMKWVSSLHQRILIDLEAAAAAISAKPLPDIKSAVSEPTKTIAKKSKKKDPA